MSKRCMLLPVFVAALGMAGAIAHADNQLRNWEFDEPLAGDNWWLWETTDFERVEPVPDTTMSGDMSLRIVIPDGAAGSLQLIQSYLELVRGETYYISFMARADAPRVISTMLLGRSTNNWAQYWLAPGIELTTQVQTFTFEYTHTGPTVGGTGNFNDDIDLYFNLNDSDIDLNIDRVWLDMVPPPEIQVPVAARKPDPATMATDVPIDAILAWRAGEYAVTHDVYLGTAFADVNDASRSDPRGVLVSLDQADSTYDPAGTLEYGRTYYWRIDEVNAPSSDMIFKGDIWSFTVEPFAYPITSLTVSASSEQPGSPATRTIDGSGLDVVNDQHDVNTSQMWMTPGGLPAWIQYTFDNDYKLDELWVWNANSQLEPFMGFGVKDVTIECSTDGATWTTIENVPEFAQGPGVATYTPNTTVNLGGTLARHVRLTINATWGSTGIASLSEVRFFHAPVRAFGPEPADGATGVNVEPDLEWRPGRDATSHIVYIGADSSAVAGGAVSGHTVADHGYRPEGLLLATQYFWKVDEVADADTYAGDVWSFTTEDYLVVEDFESYTDDMDAEETVFQTWIDGYDDTANGSIVGIDPAANGTFCETSIVHGGRQSMPLFYNNAEGATYAEATRTFDDAQDWSARGIRSLSFYFRGAAGNSGQLYAKINNAKVAYDGSASDLTLDTWQAWTIDLSAVGNVTSVRSLTIGVEGSGAAGTLYVDDIRLSP
ncbi:MAG: discoidin domain-containing protein [Phycisphaerales bacterium]